MATVSYTLRISDELKGKLEAVAEREQVSLASLVVRACWMMVDPVSSPATIAHAAIAKRASLPTATTSQRPSHDPRCTCMMCGGAK